MNDISVRSIVEPANKPASSRYPICPVPRSKAPFSSSSVPYCHTHMHRNRRSSRLSPWQLIYQGNCRIILPVSLVVETSFISASGNELANNTGKTVMLRDELKLCS